MNILKVICLPSIIVVQVRILRNYPALLLSNTYSYLILSANPYNYILKTQVESEHFSSPLLLLWYKPLPCSLQIIAVDSLLPLLFSLLPPLLKIPYRPISLKEANVFIYLLSLCLHLLFFLSLYSNHLSLFFFLEHTRRASLLCLWTFIFAILSALECNSSTY